MKPYLTLTAADPEALPRELVGPNTLRGYLTSSALGVVERIRTISTASSELVHANVDHATLLKMLTQYRKAVSVVQPKLDNQLVGLMLPPNAKDIELYQASSDLYAHLAALCKRIILESTEKPGRAPVIAEEVTQACYWGIFFLAERLRCAYGSYTQVPRETWYEIHQIYQYSLAKGVESTRIEVDEKHTIRSIKHLYKRALLLGICDPYHFQFRASYRVFKALDYWAKLARITTQRRDRESCSFLIDPNTDKPAIPILPNTRVSAGPDCRYLDTSTLVSALNLDLNTMRQQTGPDEQESDDIVRTLDNKETLKKLITSWGVHPTRGSGRKRSNSKCDLVVGLGSVAALVSGIDPQREQDNFYIRNGLEVFDESTNGLRICVDPHDRLHVRVGELIAFRNRRTSSEWSIGTVRWAQMDTDDKFYIGMYRLLDNRAVPVDVRRVVLPEGTIFGSAMPGIWTIRNTGEHEAASLIVDNNLYRPGETLCVEQGGTRHFLEMEDVVLSTRWFIWFDLNLPDSTPELTAKIITPPFELQRV